MAGKGSKPRKVDGEKYRDNFDKIFNKPEFEFIVLANGAGRKRCKKCLWESEVLDDRYEGDPEHNAILLSIKSHKCK